MPFFGDAVTVSLMLLGTCSRIASSTPRRGITSYLGRRRASACVPPTSCSLSVLLMNSIFPPSATLGCSLRESPRTRRLETRAPRRRHPSALGSLIGTRGTQLLLGVLGLKEDPVGYDGRDRLLRALDFELDAYLAVLDRHHRKADILVQSRRVAGGGDLTYPLAVLVDREVVDHRAVVVRPELATPELDADQLAADPLLADLPEGLLADKVLLLRELDHPLVAVADLVGVGVVPHVATQGEDAALDPADVAGPDRGDPVRLAGLEYPVPELHPVAAGVLEVQLVAELAGVAGARDDELHPVELPVNHVVVGHFQDIFAEEVGHHFLGLGALDLHRAHVRLPDLDVHPRVVGEPLSPQ